MRAYVGPSSKHRGFLGLPGLPTTEASACLDAAQKYPHARGLGSTGCRVAYLVYSSLCPRNRLVPKERVLRLWSPICGPSVLIFLGYATLCSWAPIKMEIGDLCPRKRLSFFHLQLDFYNMITLIRTGRKPRMAFLSATLRKMR